jgi:hypothetical protein
MGKMGTIVIAHRFKRNVHHTHPKDKRRNTMRNLISVIVLSGLMAALPAMAGEQNENSVHNAHSHHFLSKRHHAHSHVVKQSAAEQPWVGTSMVVGSEKNANHAQTLKLHMIGKRSH